MKNSRLAYLITSLLALFNVLFLPIYTAPAEVMAETGTTLGFYNACYMLLRLPNPLEYWTVSMTFAIFVPCIALFVSAMIAKQVPFLISALAGVTLWGVIAWSYANQFGLSDMFAFDGKGVGIGLWIAIIVLLIATVFGIVGKDQKD